MTMTQDFSPSEKKAQNDEMRIAELEKQIARYQKSYYDGEAEISDDEFDRLWDELRALDAENPLLKKIGADSAYFS